MEELCNNDREVWKGEKAWVEAWRVCGWGERSWTWDVIFVIDIASVFLYYQYTALVLTVLYNISNDSKPI